MVRIEKSKETAEYRGPLKRPKIAGTLSNVCERDCGRALKRLNDLREYRRELKCTNQNLLPTELYFGVIEKDLKKCVAVGKSGTTDDQFYARAGFRSEDLDLAFSIVANYAELMYQHCEGLNKTSTTQTEKKIPESRVIETYPWSDCKSFEPCLTTHPAH